MKIIMHKNVGYIVLMPAGPGPKAGAALLKKLQEAEMFVDVVLVPELTGIYVLEILK